MRTLDIIVADKVYRLDLASLTGKPLQVCIDGQPLEVSIRSVEDHMAQLEQMGVTRTASSLSMPCTGKPVMADIHFNHYPE